MKLSWQVTDRDIRKLKLFVAEYKDDPFVLRRKQRNLGKEKKRISKVKFWHAMVACLLTTQQRSGPDTPINRFIRNKPFLLGYKTCQAKLDLEKFIVATLTEFGGIRRTNNIARELNYNLGLLEDCLWKQVFQQLRDLQNQRTAKAERATASFIAECFKGFGPKQSRNLLQDLGLIRWEILIDSRTTKWLKGFGFPVCPSAAALSDPGYYNLVVNGLQHLCRKARVYPCILDAAIFTSFDKGRWSEEKMTF